MPTNSLLKFRKWTIKLWQSFRAVDFFCFNLFYIRSHLQYINNHEMHLSKTLTIVGRYGAITPLYLNQTLLRKLISSTRIAWPNTPRGQIINCWEINCGRESEHVSCGDVCKWLKLNTLFRRELLIKSQSSLTHHVLF